MTRKPFAAAVLVLLTATTAMAADLYTIDKTHSNATFKIRHFVSKTAGKFNDFNGKIVINNEQPEASSVEFTIKTASIDTDDEKRDAHLRSADFFDAEKYPEITFKSSKIKKVSNTKYAVTGNLSMHGVTKQIELPVTFLGFIKDPWGGQRAGFEIETILDRKDYGITWNKQLDEGGFLLSDEVDININLETVQQKPEAAKAK